ALSSPALTRCDQALAEAKQRLAAVPLPAGKAGSPSNGYHSAISTAADVEKWVQVDLGRAVPIDAVILIPARPTDFPDTPGFGFPPRFRVAVSDDAAFTHPRTLVDRTGADFPNPGDEPVLIPGGGAAARF